MRLVITTNEDDQTKRSWLVLDLPDDTNVDCVEDGEDHWANTVNRKAHTVVALRDLVLADRR